MGRTTRTPLSRPANVLGMFHLFAPNRKARWASGCFWRSLWIGMPVAGQCVGGEEYDVLDESAVSAHFVKHVSRLIVAANKDGSVPASPLFRHVAAVVEQSAEDEHTRGPFEKITARYEQLSPVLAGDVPPHHLCDPVADPAAPAPTTVKRYSVTSSEACRVPGGLRRLSGLRRIRVL